METWDTAGRRPAEQYPYWREVICQAFTTLNPVAEARSSFHGSVSRKQLLDVTVSQVSSGAQSVYRGPREIRATRGTEYFFANMQMRGQCVVRQDGREVLIRPGDFYVVDTTRPYDLIFGDWSLLCIRIPRATLLPALRNPRAATAVRLCDDGGMGSITGAYLRSLVQCPETLPVSQQRALVDSLTALLANTLGATEETLENGRAAVRRGTHDAVLRHIEARLAEPGLSTAAVAAHFRVSARYLQLLLEEHGQSFQRHVVERRLARCAAELACPGSRAPVSEIAQRWGFANFSSFCRVFRARYGVAANEYRAGAGAH